MKQQLTKEQSQRLIELGVPVEKASVNIVEETHGESHSWTYPTFTIGDLLNILPKVIFDSRDNHDYSFNIRWCSESYEVCYYNRTVAHSLFPIIHKKELLDALFDLVVLCAKNKIELQKMKIKYGLIRFD